MKQIKYAYYAAITLALCIPQLSVHAQDLPGLIWSDRVSKEVSDGEIIERAPYVEIGTIRLSRFSQMQSLVLQETTVVGEGDDIETLYIFRAWQGGASQGEQLMLVTISEQGVDVIGPYEQNFEKLVVVPAKDDLGPIFELFTNDTNDLPVKLEYFEGQLIEQKTGAD